MYTTYKVQLSSYGYVNTTELNTMNSIAKHFQEHPKCSVAIFKLPLGASLQVHPPSSLSHLKTGFPQRD